MLGQKDEPLRLSHQPTLGNTGVLGLFYAPEGNLAAALGLEPEAAADLDGASVDNRIAALGQLMALQLTKIDQHDRELKELRRMLIELQESRLSRRLRRAWFAVVDFLAGWFR